MRSDGDAWYTVVVLADHGFPFPNLHRKIEMSNLHPVMEFGLRQAEAVACLREKGASKLAENYGSTMAVTVLA